MIRSVLHCCYVHSPLESSAKKLRIVVLGPGGKVFSRLFAVGSSSAEGGRKGTQLLAGVGKSCLTLRYTRSTFVESYDPTIEDAFRHQSLVDDRVVIMEILDTAGQEEFTCLSQSWVENKDGFLLVFSLIDGSSFNSLNTYYQMVVKEYDAKEKGRPPIVLVGNKADLLERRQVPQSQILERAQLWRCEYIETSAKTGLNVDKCFATLVRAIRALQNDEQPSGGGSSGRNGGRRSDKKSKICFIL